MAHASRNERRKRRIRRNVSNLGRENRQLQAKQFQMWTHLLAILSQNGGEVTVTEGTLEQVFQQMRRTTYKVIPSETDKGGYIFRLVVAEEAAEGNVPTPETVETTEAEPVAEAAGPEPGESKYDPHQGQRERERRLRQAGVEPTGAIATGPADAQL